jgi:hypothetical protein
MDMHIKIKRTVSIEFESVVKYLSKLCCCRPV